MRAAWVGAASIRDLLVIITTFSLLSVFLTYHLGFHASRLRLGAADMSLVAGGTSRDSPALHPGDLRLLLRKLEEEQLEKRGNSMEVKFHGLLATLRRDLPLYSRALRKAGFRSRSNISILQKSGNITRSTSGLDTEDWCLLLCILPLESDDDSCFSEINPMSLIPSQKIGRIPGIRTALWRRRGLCRSRSRLQAILHPSPPPPSPPCYALPEQFEELLTAADGPRFNTSWVLKPDSGRPETLTTMEFFNRVRRKEFSESFEGIVEEYIPNQLRIFGYQVSVQYYLLITSMEPLRVYLYNEGLVHFRQEQDKGYRKIPSKSWFLSQMWRHLSKASLPVRLAMERTDEILMHTILMALDAISGPRDHASRPYIQDKMDVSRFRCWNCFQLMAVELAYNTSLHPEVLEFDGQPSMKDASWEGNIGGRGGARPWNHATASNAIYALKSALLLEMLKILFASDSVYEDAFVALQSTAEDLNIGIAGGNCEIWHAVCLSMDDLRFILDTRREAMHLNDFRRIYPTSNSEHYSKLISELQMLPTTDFLGSRDKRQYLTPKMHVLLSRLEATFTSQDVPEYEYSYVTEARLNNSSFNSENFKVSGSSLPQNDAQGSAQQRHSCSSEESATAYLRQLEIHPLNIHLEPPFTPFWTEYTAVVPYDMTMVRITASPMRCSFLVRFDDHIGPTMSVNTTLGVGANRLLVHLVDSIGSVINTYATTVRRRNASEGDPAFDPSLKHSVCSLRQECDLRVSPTEPCGLLEEDGSGAGWTTLLRSVNELPPCRSGDAPGRWILPCISCSQRDSCAWRTARWQPFACTHRRVAKEDLGRCLDGKKLLFLGDSTNRGMMHYIMERLNGSLGACDKTHYIRVYDNLNKGRTTFTFAYYPQFWLPSSERPAFDKALYQLLLKSQPLQNNSDTVIIVGGVHWLATQHLHALIRTLQREGLQGASLIVKTLGAGFHTPVEGVHYLPKVQQEKLLLHSMGLAEFARQHDMEVVDTFNITIAKYKDFLQGKCACHFHKIVEIPNSEGGRQPLYKVEGPINAIYSEILLSRLCRGSAAPGA